MHYCCSYTKPFTSWRWWCRQESCQTFQLSAWVNLRRREKHSSLSFHFQGKEMPEKFLFPAFSYQPPHSFSRSFSHKKNNIVFTFHRLKDLIITHCRSQSSEVVVKVCRERERWLFERVIEWVRFGMGSGGKRNENAEGGYFAFVT